MEIFVGAVALILFIGLLAILREFSSNQGKNSDAGRSSKGSNRVCVGIAGLDDEFAEANRQHQERLVWMNAPGHEHLR